MNPPTSSRPESPPKASEVESSAAPTDSIEQLGLHKRTLPPPEWDAPKSVSNLALEWLQRDAPTPRRRGPRAEVAALRADLRAAQAAHDDEHERRAAAAVARALAARGVELDAATKLARRALMLGEDSALREELSAWFAGIGEAGLAAATLRPLLEIETGARLARVLTRIAVFLGRTGDAAGAADALGRAMAEDSKDPVPAELRGAIAAWAPDAIASAEAAQAYLEGGRRREALGDKAAAFEDLLRAFEISPDSAVVAELFASGLASRGLVHAADEVLRQCAQENGENGRAMHRARMRDAYAEGDLARALGAAFDAELDAELDIDAALVAAESAARGSAAPGADFDSLLVRAGLPELLAARLEVALDGLPAPHATRARIALGKLYAGSLANADRAVDHWIFALDADPANEVVKALLREYAASTGDYGALVEALIRAGQHLDGATPERQACLRELMILADQRLSDPSLSLWAARALAQSQESEHLDVLGARLAPRAKLQDENLTAIRASLATARGAARIEQLRLAAVALKGRPSDVDEYITVLQEIAPALPEERHFRIALERALVRRRRFTELESLWKADLGPDQISRSAIERSRIGLSLLRLRAGDPRAALDELWPLLEDGTQSRLGICFASAIAARLGDREHRAIALVRIGSLLPSSAQATLASIAAEVLWSAGNQEGARKAAEHGCRADPSLPRPVWTLARVLAPYRDRFAAVATERAIAVGVPRAFLCQELADTLEALGEPALALAWTQRWLGLRPGDPAAAAALLRRVTLVGDASRIADSIAWLLSQPQPLVEFTPLLGAAARRLAELDGARGAAIARRLLDVFGPRIAELRETVIAIADATGEASLAIAVIERQLAAGTPGPERADVLLSLARRRRLIGDADGAARCLVRALGEGADTKSVLEELRVALPPRGSDGEIALLEARAAALRAEGADSGATASAWREYGAALWDLAGDREGAVQAWECAAELDSEKGLERFARDLVVFGGHQEALARLQQSASRRKARAEVARVLSCAAVVALDGEMPQQALAIAVLALEHDPSRADVLAVAERAAGPADIELLERAYDLAASGALGVYGERAAHYRAARLLERRNERQRALRHAIRAFEAVPAEGVTFVLMMRLAERTGDPTDAVEALQRISTAASSTEERAAWLRRAALVAGTSSEGNLQRVEVLLRALEASPDVETVRSLGVALAELGRTKPEEKETTEGRYRSVVERMLARLEGPEGARIAVQAARTSLELLLEPTLSLIALTRAVEVDANIDEYSAVLSDVGTLAKNADKAAAFVDRVIAEASAQFSNLGDELTDLASAVARALGDARREATLLVEHAKRHLDDTALFSRAEEAARQSGDEELVRALLAAVPPAQRVRRLEEIAYAAIDVDDVDSAISAFEEIAVMEDVVQAERERALGDLKQLYLQVGRKTDLEALLKRELRRMSLPPDAKFEALREYAGVLVETGRGTEAFTLLSDAASNHPRPRVLFDDILKHARRLEDTRWQIHALEHLLDFEQDPHKRLSLLAQLARQLETAGDDAGALARWEQVLAQNPKDRSALSAIERGAERRGDWHRVVELLDARAQGATTNDDIRRVRLRRAEVLETKLGRPDEARAVLEALLAEMGDHLETLTRLADLNERLGAKLRAAPLWRRASTVTNERGRSQELARRACQAFLDGGDVDSAKRVLDEIGKRPRTPSLVSLRVEVERRRENPRGLAEALEEKALVSMDSPSVRAAMLIEAANASLAAGESTTALSQAQRAARIAPNAAEPQLFARLLEYRHHGFGGADEAKTTVQELEGIEESMSAPQRELHAFLLAEAYDRAGSPERGLELLSQALQQHGSMPLIALGLAERLGATTEPSRALPLFEVALDGDLRSLRRRGALALVAAQTAERAEAPDRALRYLDIAASVAETRAQALSMQADIRASLGRISEAPHFAEELRRIGDRPSQRPTVELSAFETAPTLRQTPPSVPPPQGTPAEVEAAASPPSNPPPSSLRAMAPPKPRVERRGSRASSAPPPPIAAVPTISETPPEPPSAPPIVAVPPRIIVASPPGVPVDPTIISAPPPDLPLPPVVATSLATSPSEPSVVSIAPPISSGSPEVVSEAPSPATPSPRSPPPPNRELPETAAEVASSMPPAFPPFSESEAALLKALSRGSVEAGKELIRALEHRSDRTQDLVNVCRRVALLLPGDWWSLEKLYDATVADRNMAYARAIEHVLHAFDPTASPVDPPPLADQLEQPDRVQAMLFRETGCPATEALGHVWNGAQHMFRRDPTSYGVTGLERISPTGPSPLAQLFGAAARVLGTTRTPVFQRRNGTTITINVALLSPPALIVTGDVRNSSATLSYHLGAMLVASLPEHVLLYGAPEGQVRNVLRALVAAFGPPHTVRGQIAPIVTLAEMLWESVPARSQRRLRELCDDPTNIQYEIAVASARQAVRRAGLFACGDLMIAVRETCADLGISPRGLESPGGLAALCASSPAVADLVRLATSPEFADARWQHVRGGGRRSSPAWSTL